MRPARIAPRLRRLDCACGGDYLSKPLERATLCERPVIDYSRPGQLYAIFSIADQLAAINGLKFYDLLPDSRGPSHPGHVRTLAYQECFRLDIDHELIAEAFGRSKGTISTAHKRWKRGHKPTGVRRGRVKSPVT